MKNNEEKDYYNIELVKHPIAADLICGAIVVIGFLFLAWCLTLV